MAAENGEKGRLFSLRRLALRVTGKNTRFSFKMNKQKKPIKDNSNMIDKSQATPGMGRSQRRNSRKLEIGREAGDWQVPNKGVPYAAPRLTAPVVNLFTLSSKFTFTALFVILKHMSLVSWLDVQIYQKRALVEDEACLSGSSDAPALP